MSREPIPTWFFVLVAVRHKNKYLLVHEAKHGQMWYFPAGRVEPGEDFIAAAKRETLEEAGIPIEVTGIVRIEHTTIPQGVRMRLIVTARPIDNSPPKSIADDESLEARWFTFHEIHRLALRSDHVLAVFDYLEQGGEVAPVTVLSREGKPFC